MDQTADPNVNQVAHASQGQNPAPNVDMARVKYGAWLVGGAFVVLGVVFGVAVSRFTRPQMSQQLLGPSPLS